MSQLAHATSSNVVSSPLLRLEGISRDFDGVRALDDVNFDLRAGEIHVLLGENGAGKSTLINIVSGALHPTRGQMMVAEIPVHLKSARHARMLGISAVYQEFSLVGTMTVAENLFLGAEIARSGILARSAMQQRARAFLDELGFDIDEGALIDDLTRGRQQMVEIGKALMTRARVLILDEPTASLTEAESASLFQVLGKLRETGVGIIYISHRMKEIRALADRITIMRDGKHVATLDNDGRPDRELIRLMSGREVPEIYPPKAPVQAVSSLVVSGLTLASGRVWDASITIAKGEIVGVAGLVGCGKSELGRALFGMEVIAAGAISLDGVAFSPSSPRDALRGGVCYFPSDRAAEGLALDRSVVENASLSAIRTSRFASHGFIRKTSEASEIHRVLTMLDLRPLDIHRPAGAYSGGNRQKIVLARGFTENIGLFIFDEPTVGIDVSAKVEIYATIARLAANGSRVLVISSELPEIIGLCHRVYVMNKGRMARELRNEEVTERNILPHFFSA